MKIRLRRGTAAEWTAANPTLLLGEMGIETDTRKFKFGDGSAAWNSLLYASADAPSLITKVTVADQTARYALTISQVQNGDYVFQTDTSTLYEVIDDTQLDDAAGYVALATVAWSAVTGKPSTFPPTIGSGAGDAVAGNDARLTDARTPTAHTHAASEISDSTTAGRAMLTAVDAAAQRALLNPPKVLEVVDSTARFAVTSSQVNVGDIVREVGQDTIITIECVGDVSGSLQWQAIAINGTEYYFADGGDIHIEEDASAVDVATALTAFLVGLGLSADRDGDFITVVGDASLAIVDPYVSLGFDITEVQAGIARGKTWTVVDVQSLDSDAGYVGYGGAEIMMSVMDNWSSVQSFSSYWEPVEAPNINVNNGSYDPGTGLFTAPAAGLYLMIVNVLFHNDVESLLPGKVIALQARKNGNEDSFAVKLFSEEPANMRTVTGVLPYALEEGDTLGVYAEMIPHTATDGGDFWNEYSGFVFTVIKLS